MSDDANARWQAEYDARAIRKDRFVTLSFEDVTSLGVPTDAEVPEAIGYPGAHILFNPVPSHRSTRGVLAPTRVENQPTAAHQLVLVQDTE